MSDLLIIKQRNKLMVAMIWFVFITDLAINLINNDMHMVKLETLAAVPLLALITYFVFRNIWPNLTMYLISVCFLTVLIILNIKDEGYINLFFLILPPVFSVTNQNWKNILFATGTSAFVFSYFFLINGESYYTYWKQSDLFYFLLFFLTYGILNASEARFSEGIRSKLIDELNRVKQLQNNLHDSEERYKAIVKQSSDGIFVFHPQCKSILETNERLCKMLGYQEHELLKLSLADFTVLDDTTLAYIIDNILKNHRYFAGETVYRCKNGKQITVEVTGTVITLKNENMILFNIHDITKQKENEQLLRQIYDNMTDMIVKMDHQYRIQFVSPASKRIIGYNPAELISHSIFDNIYQDDRNELLALSNQSIKKRFVFRYRHLSGQFIWLEAAGDELVDKEGRMIGAIIVCRDITERMEAEAIIQKQDQLLNGAAEAMNCLLTKEDHPAAIREVLAIIGKSTQADRVYIFENHNNADRKEFAMSQRYIWTKASNSMELGNPSLQTIPYIKAGFSRWFDELSCGKTIQGPVKTFPLSEQQFLKPYQVKSLLVVPIFILNEFWGFIGFDDCENESYWNKREEVILLTAAAGIGGAIRQYQDEKLLLESEEKYRLIADNMSDFVTVLDCEGKILYASPSHEKVLKIKPAELEGTYLHENMHPDDKESFLKAFHKMLEQKINLKLDVHWRFRETWLYFAMRGKPVVEEDKEIQRVVIVARNITQRIRMEEKIKQTSARLEALISNIPYGILAADKENNIILLNHQFEDLCGFQSCSETLSEIHPAVIHELGKNIFLEEELYTKRSKEILDKRMRVLDEEWELKDGRIINRDAIPIYVNHQFDGFLWQFKDITEQKKLEQKFREASLMDGLTKIPNRRFLDDTIAKEWKRCGRASKPLTIIMIDIDYFKNYNDMYGHQEGDECLIRVAQTIKETLQRPFDVVCRYGGEEFVVILPETNQEGGLKKAAKIRKAIESLEIPHTTSTVSSYVTCSFGVATAIPSPFINPEELIWRADKALYTSKTNGRNQVNNYDKEKGFTKSLQ